MISAIFFDFDGVILDSVGVKTAAFEKLFAVHGTEKVERLLEYHLQHGGISRLRKFQWFYREVLGRELTAQEETELAAEFARLSFQEVLGADWIRGAEEFLKSQTGRMPMFVVSGTPEDELKEIVKQRGMEPYFTRVCGSPKTKVAIVQELLGEFGLLASDTLFVGDAMTDFDTASECGQHFVGIHSNPATKFPEGTFVIPDCCGLGDWLARMQLQS